MKTQGKTQAAQSKAQRAQPVKPQATRGKASSKTQPVKAPAKGQARKTQAAKVPAKAAVRKAQPAQSKSQPAKAPARAKTPSKAQPAKAPAKTQAGGARASKVPAVKTPPSKTQPAKVQPTPAKPAATKASLGRLGPTKNTSVSRPAPVKAPPKPTRERLAFFERQRQLLLEERDQYLRSADALKAQADSLALEHEPGDVQFDEEGGEGGTSNIDREMDLVLSAQARSAAAEIDRALAKIEAGTYGYCEQCGDPIPEPRLQALPYAALCVSCKSGGLSSRR